MKKLYKPYTKVEFAEKVAQGEARLGAHQFFAPVGLSVAIAAPVEHDAECGCLAQCFNRKLDALLAKTEKSLEDMESKLVVGPEIQEIDYVG